MKSYNDIGISSELDRGRIAHLLKLGILAALMGLAADFVLGWGTTDNSLSGMEQYFSRYLAVSEGRVICSAILGLIGIPLECLCYFGIYWLIASKSQKLAHTYRSGLIGMLAFGAFTHVMCCAVIFYLKSIYAVDPAAAIDGTVRFAMWFLLPVTILFLPFFITAAVTQFIAFVKGFTPYPKWCCIFSILSGIPVVIIAKLFGDLPLVNAISTGWISWGGLITFGGLLIAMKKADM